MSCIRTLGKKSTPHRNVTDPPRQRANKQKGKGTYENDRPPILSLISRTTHEVRYWVLEHADKATTRTIIEGNVPPAAPSSILMRHRTIRACMRATRS